MWILERSEGSGQAIDTPIGWTPTADAIDLTGIDQAVSPETMAQLVTVNEEAWVAEVDLIRDHYARFGDRLPAALATRLDPLADSL